MFSNDMKRLDPSALSFSERMSIATSVVREMFETPEEALLCLLPLASVALRSLPEGKQKQYADNDYAMKEAIRRMQADQDAEKDYKTPIPMGDGGWKQEELTNEQKQMLSVMNTNGLKQAH